MRTVVVSKPQQHYTPGELPSHGKTCCVGRYTDALVDSYLQRTEPTVRRVLKMQAASPRGRGGFQKQRLHP